MNSGDLRKKREQDLRSRLEKNPDDRTTRLEYAILLSSSGRDDEAARQFRIAFERHSDDPEAATLYIRFLLARGRGDEAGSVIEQALEHNPMEVEVLKAHAQVLQSNDEYEAALEQLELVRQLTDDDPNLDYSIIECLISTNDLQQAIQRAEFNSMEFPDCPIRLHSLARAYWGADKREMARDKLLEAQKLQPNSLNILLDACGVLTDLENYDEAIRLLLDKAEYFAHSADYHYALGNLFADKGDTEHARKMYLTAIEIDPHHFHALNNLAILLQDRQAPSEQVENFYRRALDANPDDVFANFNYGNFLLVKGRSAEAIDHYHKVIESEPWYVKARIAYAGALLELGRRDEALEEMREIGEEDIISPDEASELGMLYLSANEEETGERLLRSAVRRGEGKSARAFEDLGSFYLEKGEVVEAVKCFIRAVLIKPFDTNLWLKVVASIIEARATFEVSAHIEEFLFEELPEEVEEAERDEIVSVCKVINESVGTREYKSLKPFVRAAWETKQPALLTVLAKLCAFFDRQEEAEKAFRAALKEAPRDIAAHREYIGYLMELGQDKRALQAVRRAMKNVPDETMLENDHALILYRLGRTEEAKQEFFKLSRSKPLEITFVYNYAWMLHQEGHLAPAAGILEQFLSKVGFDNEAAFFCAQILAETRDRNNFIRAIGYLEKVIAANDTDERAWSLLGLLQMETGDLKGANFSYSKALKNAADDPAVLVMTASFFTGTLQFKKASFTLELLRKTDPENENLLVELARYHQARGQYDHSVEPLQELFLRAPEDYDFTLACTLHHLGERAESRAVVAGAFEREVSRADSVARGWYHFLEGDVEKAVSVTTLGMAEYAESSDFRNLAIYYLAQGRYEEARGLLQVFMRLVTQPLDVVFFIKDLESYADRFPRTEARDFTLELAVKLRDMLDPLEEQAGTPDDVAP